MGKKPASLTITNSCRRSTGCL